jgi:hypothetical protein
MTSKYDPLTEYLLGFSSDKREVTVTFKKLESILGFALPKSAIDYQQWWANPSGADSHVQAQGWIGAGFKVDTVKLKKPGGWVRFVRV